MPVVRIITLPFTAGWQWLTSLSLFFSIPALLIALLAGVYTLWFVIETPVTFTYSGDACVSRLTFWPEGQRQVDSSPFEVTFQHKIKFLDLSIASLQSCIAMKEVADPDHYSVRLSPLGNWLAMSTYRVMLPEPPEVSVAALAKPIPLTKPVVLGLSTHDETFAYALQANSRESDCAVAAMAIRCELDELALEQGKTYEFAVARYFEEEPVETVVEKQTEILKATAVTETSIKPDEVVVSKPTDFIVKFDKPILTLKAEMVKLGGEKPELVAAETELGKAEVKLTFGELPRQAEFEVKIDKLEAQDGSSLVEPFAMRFKTSGGPRVAGVSIPKAGVALGATAVLSFDQEVSVEQDIVSQVKVVGGPATINRRGNTIVIGLTGFGKCTDFTITVGNDIQSIYGVSGNSAWSYASRTICHTLETIGYSVKGRPIYAYFFGGGGTTILFTGAIHGNELSSSYLMDNWINELEVNARNLPTGKQIVVIPEANPDGVVARTRNNANNVDLNRNFDVSDWKADITDTYGNSIPNGGGTEPMSEPETKALAAFTSRLRPRLTMSFHSIGGLVIANQAGDSVLLASSYSRLTGYGNATGQSSTTFDYAISGTYDDWIAEKLSLPSVLVELGSHTYSQFPTNKAALWEMARR